MAPAVFPDCRSHLISTWDGEPPNFVGSLVELLARLEGWNALVGVEAPA